MDMCISFTFIFICLASSVLTPCHGRDTVEYETIEGDVRLTRYQRDRVYNPNKSRNLGAIDDDDTVGLWRGHYVDGAFEIPVTFDESDEHEGANEMTPDDAVSILSKLREMEVKLGGIIRFVTDVNPLMYPDGYIRVGIYTAGCWSYVGRLPSQYQPQVVNIGTGCDFTDTLEHEFMHALGFFHEHSRPDRDTHVVIHWSNIAEEKFINFEKTDFVNSRDSPYDRRSIMHYGNYAFALNPQFKTITSTDNEQPVVGSSFTMSDVDINQIRMLYRCHSKVVDSYNTNCDSECPCALGEGICSSDDGCSGPLMCDEGTCTDHITTDAPTVLGETHSPTTTPTTSPPTTSPPTFSVSPVPSPTTPTTPTTPPVQLPVTGISVNVVLLVGFASLAVGIVAGSLFM
jgi:hypothetical protein